MEVININNLLERQEEVAKMKDILTNFEKTKHNLTTKKGIYIYGDPGTGKTTFVTNILKELDYVMLIVSVHEMKNKAGRKCSYDGLCAGTSRCQVPLGSKTAAAGCLFCRPALVLPLACFFALSWAPARPA